MVGQLGHGMDVFFKDYAGWISSKQYVSEMERLIGNRGQLSLNYPQKSERPLDAACLLDFKK
jgi:hypothetical protein